MRKILLAAALCLMVLPALAQTPVSESNPDPKKIDDDFVHQQFGDQFTYISSIGAASGDLDGDGVEDVVIAARCKNPMADKDEYSFVIADPYDTFLGYGDVKVTSTFASDAPERRGVSLLIIHGAEKDAWRADKPKAKFLMINLPFKTVTVKRLAIKKKTVLGIYMEEVGEGESTSSVLFWDGKKYKYMQLGSTLE